MLPLWNQQIWGSPAINKVVVLSNLILFLAKCKQRNIMVGLSSWFREDIDNIRMLISSPEILAEVWITTLNYIKNNDLLDVILYVDLCNEWPLNLWCPFFYTSQNNKPLSWCSQKSMYWMEKSTSLVKTVFPNIPICFSFDNDRVESYLENKTNFDLIEHHIWMSKENNEEYYKQVGYYYERFDDTGYKNMALKSESIYKQKPDYWKALLTKKIDRISTVSKQLNIPLITTECWSIVDYKDWPLLSWDWVKELCEYGVRTAINTQQWIAIATSNFCGPQFITMWKDINWHLKLTELIKSSKINKDLYATSIIKRSIRS